ncbi:Asp-tRNA(Asn)/Glu-tRNA(Gln) amidotransferase subunit GatA [Citricoccus sp. SGAir0253]|uniref:amidase n=1 Tax=Citricoccus sp. SGAir0253 TaxID=2567881 RepID=UPI0010CCCCA4|nr:amidase [Citricoccus sp. SGAir0253]QCU77959.1 Asp-tRNA(Asn)/Glu-tRNA(Gln) amidotransferase subunit GatA [Citricoccus sp. SGAir0253]
MEPYELTLAQSSAAIAAGELSPVELTGSCLQLIDAAEPHLNAMVTRTAEAALAQAEAAQEQIARTGPRGPLHGIPYGAKDLYNTQGVLTTSSSAVRAEFVPDQDSAAVAALNEAGMVLLGKTHTHEFAFGGITPTTRNPWDTTRVPGGSSGGSAAAVAAGYFPIALGTDTAGSIRIPSSVCGTVGIKPTYGRTSRYGVASLSWSLDHVGPITRTVADAAVVLGALAGYDPRDPASVDRTAEDFTVGLGAGVEGLRIGVPQNYYTDAVDPDVAAATARAVEVFQDAGAIIVPVTVPLSERYKAAEWAIMLAEASAYHRETMRSDYELYTEDVRAFLEVGETILAADYIDAHRHRQQIKTAWQQLLTDVDLVLAPTTPMPAVPADQLMYEWADGTREHATEGYTRLCIPANLTGLPAISVPSGFTDTGLPLGVQLIGRAFEEATVLRAAHHFETANDHVGRLAPFQDATAGRA